MADLARQRVPAIINEVDQCVGDYFTHWIIDHFRKDLTSEKRSEPFAPRMITSGAYGRRASNCVICPMTLFLLKV